MSSLGKAYIKKIVGKQLLDVGRASDMLWLAMGEIIVVNDYKGNKTEKSSLALHVQCPWRLVNQKEKSIFIASYDIYEVDEELDWDVQGNNLFDQKIREWKNVDDSVYISNVCVNNIGDLEISISNDYVFQIFVNTSTEEECWRFFECNTGKAHFLMTGKGIKEE